MQTSMQQRPFDVIVVGSGIAGLYAAIKAADFATVCLLTKGKLQETNTWFAQGGIAAALGEDDSPHEHFLDTIAAGAGACDPEAVAVLVEEGPNRIADLLALGAPFDRLEDRLALGREGAHHKNRIVHCGGDATGRLVQSALQEKLYDIPNVTVLEDTFATDLVVHEGKACGVRLLSGEAVFAKAVILATGGLGQVYARTTNPVVATGDGVAMAYRAGADVADLEFIQFHPTVFHGQTEAETFLISEALRGEGAVLRDSKGKRFMLEDHAMAELGPRDVVARAIVAQMKKQNGEPVWLDITHQDASFIQERFPTIYREAKRNGFDMTKVWLPVSPAAHYAMGGIVCNLCGQTTLPGLYACGEAACSGVHGANRLASNSLLEGLVFAYRAVQMIRNSHGAQPVVPYVTTQTIATPAVDLQAISMFVKQRMFLEAGVLRSGAELIKLANELDGLQHTVGFGPRQAEWELKNLLTTAILIVRGALLRKESRGGHYRIDFPLPNPALAGRRFIQNRKDGRQHASIAV